MATSPDLAVAERPKKASARSTKKIVEETIIGPREGDVEAAEPTINADIFLQKLPAAVQKAVKAVRQKIPDLVKDVTNEYSKYDYVPIDQFYERAIPIIEEGGLSIDARQYGRPVPFGDKLIFSFKGVLTYRDGSEYAIGDVDIPIVPSGPQCSGAAHSYADKVLMRRFFKIRTGEPDADAMRPDGVIQRQTRRAPRTSAPVVQREPKPKEVAPDLPNVPTSFLDFSDYIWRARSESDLVLLYRHAEKTIEGLSETDRHWVLSLFSHRKAEVVGHG